MVGLRMYIWYGQKMKIKIESSNEKGNEKQVAAWQSRQEDGHKTSKL